MPVVQKLLLLCTLLAGHPLYAQVVKICYDDTENIPWNVTGGNGLNNQLVMQAGAKRGLEIELLPTLWKRCLLNVAEGRVAGAVGASFTDERAGFAVYPMTPGGKPDPARRIRSDGYSLYKVTGSPVSWNGESFLNLNGPVGVQLGYSVGNDLKKLGVSIEETSGNARSQMLKLTKGQLALIALLTNEGDSLLLDAELSRQVERLQPSFPQKPYFVIFNKDYYATHKNAVDLLWADIGTLRESPAFRQLIAEKLKR